MTTAEQIIKFLKMKPLPQEGGYYVETYRSREKITQIALPERDLGEKNLSTAILYLLTPTSFSHLHRITSDETFHFYLGDVVTMLQLRPDGSSEVIDLGTDIISGMRVQVTVPAGTWQGCCLKKGGKFALMGTTVAPGFEFSDFEPDRRQTLLEQYPSQNGLILKLTQK